MNETQTIRELNLTARPAGLYVRVVGDPTSDNVLITIHGGPGLSHRYMLGLEQLAGDQLAVVSYDQRGSGRSQTPAFPKDMEEKQHTQETIDFDLLTYAQDLEAVRSAVAGQKNVHLLGHSWGGLVAMHYATLYPEYISSLLLVDSVPPTWPGLQAGLARFGTRLQALQQEGILPLNLPTDPREQWQQVVRVYLSDPTFAIPLDCFEYNSMVGQQTMAVIQGFDLTEKLTKLDHRVLILWGEADPFGREWGEETKAALSSANVEFVVIPQCGHLGWFECPDPFFRPVRAFLDLNGKDKEILRGERQQGIQFRKEKNHNV